eukprot:c8643_g1_i1.p1 GENE.c8643_g1_i1~~c8643_g1_i1.p1  ORF type:complete len:1451 (-),score=377.81 c8643_g1_i1:195-4547(-)
MSAVGAVKFALNGEIINVPADEAAKMTLNEFIRTQTKFTGTKLSCGQGGCGACTVAIRKFDPSKNQIETITSNSCLLPLISVHGTEVITAEGLAGNNVHSHGHNDNPDAHPVQERLVQLQGTQCGFCTPGMVVQMWGGLQQHCHGNDGTTNCSTGDIEDLDLLVGNLCRCTGYRPIQDTLKSFGTDSNIRDQLTNKELAQGKPGCDPKFPEQLKHTHENVSEESKLWRRPKTLDSLKTLLQEVPSARIVCGHTAWGVYPNLSALSGAHNGVSADITSKLPITVQIDAVPELTKFELTKRQDSLVIHFGAGLTIASLAQQLTAAAQELSNATDVVLPLRDHLMLIAGHQVRNRGSVGGNIMLARDQGFASDIAPLLVALGAFVDVFDGKKLKEKVSLGEFLAEGLAGDNSANVLLLSFTVPLGTPQNGPTKQILRTYRTALRPRNAYSLANAAFWITLEDSTVTSSRLAFGALGSIPRRALETEALLKGKKIGADSWEGIQKQVLESVEREIGQWAQKDQPGGDHHLAYRLRLVQTFAFKLLNALSAIVAGTTVPLNDSKAGSIHARCTKRSSTEQTIPAVSAEEAALSPVFEPLPKTTALAQATGDAKFTDDEQLGRARDTLSAALVCISGAGMSYESLNDKEAVAHLGDDYVGMMTTADIQALGLSHVLEWSKFPLFPVQPTPEADYSNEYVLLPPHTASLFHGQPVAIVVARTQRVAEQAAALVKLEDVKKTGEVWLDLNTAPSVVGPLTMFRGDKAKTKKMIEDGLAGQGTKNGLVVVSGPFSKGSQNHFYMEPQSAFAIPEEEGCMTVYTSTQGTDLTLKVLSEQLKLKMHQINVKFRRVGGGFGGKITRSVPTALAAALAAKHFRVPVRLVLPRKIDSTLTGGRQELEGTWHALVDCNANGRLHALKIDLKMGQGSSADFGVLHAQFIGQAVDMCYKIDNAIVEIDLKKTSVAPRTAVRSPSHLEASMVIETVMDGIAGKLGVEPDLVRQANIHKGGGMLPQSGLSGGLLPPSLLHGNSMPALWQHLIQRSEYERRKQDIKEFNSKPENQFRKRGIAITPAKYSMVRVPGAAARVDVFEDGSIQVATTGSEIGQGLHTKAAQVVCATFGKTLGVKPAMEDIRFTNFSSEVFMYGKGAGGSTTSETVCFAVEEACSKLGSSFKDFLKTAQTAAKAAAAGSKVPTREDAVDATSSNTNNNEEAPIVEGLGLTWKKLIKAAKKGPAGAPMWAMHFSEVGIYMPPINEILYETYGAAVTEAEVDTLTGETKLLLSHVMFDTGPSLNPAIDLGQIEGAYVMGLGAMLFETTRYDEENATILTTNTWDYKVLTMYDIPEKFVVDLVDMRGQSKDGAWGVVLGTASGALGALGKPWKPTKGQKSFRASKATGEPPLLFSYSALSAVRQAIQAAGVLPLTNLPIPATAEVVSGICWDAANAGTSMTNRLSASK